MKMLFFIDGDNNITTGLNGLQHLTEEDTVLVFHSQGMALSKIRARCATSRAKISFIESVKDGKNSVDFQIVAELGVRIGKNEVQFASITNEYGDEIDSNKLFVKMFTLSALSVILSGVLPLIGVYGWIAMLCN